MRQSLPMPMPPPSFTYLAWRAWRLLSLRPGWLNHVRTRFCQSLWKCPLGMMLLCLMLQEMKEKTSA